MKNENFCDGIRTSETEALPSSSLSGSKETDSHDSTLVASKTPIRASSPKKLGRDTQAKTALGRPGPCVQEGCAELSFPQLGRLL